MQCAAVEFLLTALAVLVAVVAAVVGSIAHPAFGDAAVVGALKLSGRAKLIWKFPRKKNKKQDSVILLTFC